MRSWRIFLVVFVLLFSCYAVYLYDKDILSAFPQYVYFDDPEKTILKIERTAVELAPLPDDRNRTITDTSEFAKLRFDRRAEHLRAVCEAEIREGTWHATEVEKHHREWVRNDNFLVELERQFMMCVSPKCGSTSWHRLVRELREPLGEPNRPFGWQDRQKNNQMAQDLDPAEGARLLQNPEAFRAITVRHPFGRLISGWNERLRRDEVYSQFLVEGYPKLAQFVSDRDPDHLVAFPDMMRYLAAYGHDPVNLDFHFLPTEHLCKPCRYDYNHVVKMELLTQDQSYIKQELDVPRLPWEEKGYGYRGDRKDPVTLIRSYFVQVPPEVIRRLMRVYYYDFLLFGYTFDVETCTAGGIV